MLHITSNCSYILINQAFTERFFMIFYAFAHFSIYNNVKPFRRYLQAFFQKSYLIV